jgi:hypothetical protein
MKKIVSVTQEKGERSTIAVCSVSFMAGLPRLAIHYTTALGCFLWPETAEAQIGRIPANLGPQYGKIAQYAANIKQNNNIKSFSTQKINPSIFRVKMTVPYEFDEHIELDLLVDCSNDRIARTQGLQVAESRFEAAYYSSIIRRTCK